MPQGKARRLVSQAEHGSEGKSGVMIADCLVEDAPDTRGDDKHSRSCHGLVRSVLENHVQGVVTPFTKILDIQGRDIATLVSDTHRPGRLQAVWTGQINGRPAPSGLYFVQIKSGAFSQTQRVVVSN